MKWTEYLSPLTKVPFKVLASHATVNLELPPHNSIAANSFPPFAPIKVRPFYRSSLRHRG